MSAQTHVLKSRPNYFQQTREGVRPFEIRLDDRGFQRGDQVVLREYDDRDPCSTCEGPHGGDRCQRYSGREILAQIGFVQASTPPRGQQRGFFGNGYVVFSLVDLAFNDAGPGPVPLIADGPPTPHTLRLQVEGHQLKKAIR